MRVDVAVLAYVGLVEVTCRQAKTNKQRIEARVAAYLLLMCLGLWAITLSRASCAAAAQLLFGQLTFLGALGAATWAWGRAVNNFALGPTCAILLAIAPMLLAVATVPGVRLLPTLEDTSTSWAQSVLIGLQHQAAGVVDPAMEHVALALGHGAEAATLRGLCGPRFLSHGSHTAPGARICRAVGAVLPEAGAQSLRCAPHDARDRAADQRCRLAGELFAEAGLMGAAAEALGHAHGPGMLSLRALWRARALPLPACLEGPEPAFVQVWPNNETIGPMQLGFAVTDAPGSLTWHPQTAQAPLGVLRARSPYHGAMVTSVPARVGPLAALGVELGLQGRQDLRITLITQTRRSTFCCEPLVADGCDLSLPQSLCSQQWGRGRLEAPEGDGAVTAALIHGEFILGHWAWITAPGAMP